MTTTNEQTNEWKTNKQHEILNIFEIFMTRSNAEKPVWMLLINFVDECYQTDRQSASVDASQEPALVLLSNREKPSSLSLATKRMPSIC
jgi:hypothetical protein